MNLLLVDDQISVLDGLLHGIDYDSLGYSHVFSATNACDAIAICEKEDIHVLVTDIEMPGKSGLELNSFIQEHFPHIIRIVLTSHAVFSYAQESIKLGCFDFLVQPAPYETIAQALKRASDTWHYNFDNRRIKEYGHLFKSHENEFLAMAIENLYVGSPQEIENSIDLLNKAGYPFTMDSLIELFWVDVLPYSRQSAGYPSQQFILKTLSGIMASCPVFDDLIYFTVMSPFRMFSVFIIADSEELLPIDESVLDGLLSSLQKQLGTDDITFYYSAPVKYRNILTQIDSANKCIGNNISGRTGLIKTNGTHEAAVVSANPSANIDHWNALLSAGQFSMLKKEIDFYLSRYVLSRPNSFEILCKVHQQLLHLFFMYFYEKNIDINSIFTPEFTYRNCMDSFSTIDDVKKTVDFFIHALNSNHKMRENAEDYVTLAKNYIIERYNTDLSVKDVAEFVHLNPEYFTRLFKKETGKNIKDFITDCRISMAKDLLANSSLPISMIASEVGYNNFSYFAYLFRKIENMTPGKYRQKNGKQIPAEH